MRKFIIIGIFLALCAVSLPAAGSEKNQEKPDKTEANPGPAPTDNEIIKMSEMLEMMEILREMEMLKDYHLISGEDTHEKEN